MQRIYACLTQISVHGLFFLRTILSLAPLSLLLTKGLPLRGPSHEPFPIPAQMPGSKPGHTAYALILHLDCRVGLAHQALAYEIDAMRDVAG